MDECPGCCEVTDLEIVDGQGLAIAVEHFYAGRFARIEGGGKRTRGRRQGYGPPPDAARDGRVRAFTIGRGRRTVNTTVVYVRAQQTNALGPPSADGL